MIKNRLDWWIEHNSILPDGLYGFRRGLGTAECLSSLVGEIYSCFNKRQYLTAAFIDVKGAFDSVHIPTLISRLLALNVPPQLCNFISSLSFEKPCFSLPFSVLLLSYYLYRSSSR